tara:strand:- start:1775 stop:1966 length:192 start_codon:yes stop_codon:yes gene_type:complete
MSTTTKTYRSNEKQYKIVQYVRIDSGIEHMGMTYREALDAQDQMTKATGQQRPQYVYKVEQST